MTSAAKRTRGRGGRAVVLATTLGIALAFAGAVQAQVRGTIVGPGETAFPIAIAPLRGDAGRSDAGKAFTDTVSRDLDLSGLFRILDPASFIDDPQGSGITAEEINFGNWSTVGARVLVKGQIDVSGDQVTLEAHLFDVAERRQLGGKRYQGSRRDVRRMGNRFADEVMRLLTGQRGPFDTRIAFVSTRGGRAKEIYDTGFDGDDVRQLTQNGTINLSPSWSPDATRLLFTSFKDRRPKLYELDVASGRQRLMLAGPGLTIGGRFSPNGQTIAVSREETKGNSEILLIDANGEVLRNVSNNEGIDVSPTWSPDGRRLAFCSARAGSPQIYLSDLEGGGTRRLTSSGSYNTSPAWSPRGDKIAYTGRVGGRFQIFVVSATGGEGQQLTSSAGDNTDPSWSPDGRYLMFSSTRAGKGQIYMMDEHGARQRQLIRGSGDDSSPAWSPWLEEGNR
jgi:TolB protein